ncbi:similar to Saccharomyces cerevisiae YHR211W FLO5 Lectin-like cell wall protein (flocculin) (Partial), partial [Maudiozyma saulgeensis]
MSMWSFFHNLFLALLFYPTSSLADRSSCLPTGPSTQGFSARFFPYRIGSTQATNNNLWVQGLYMTNNPIGTSNNIIDPNYSVRPCILGPTTFTCPLSASLNWADSTHLRCNYQTCKNADSDAVGNINMYGFMTTATNITVELSGYLYTTQTGNYSFSLNNVDDAASITVGAGVAFDCCAQSDQHPSLMFYSDVVSIKPSVGAAMTVSSKIYLYAGNYYPVKIVYTNSKSVASLGTTLTLPDGTVISNWGSQVYSYMDSTNENNIECIAGTDISTNSRTSVYPSSSTMSSLYILSSSTRVTSAPLSSSKSYSSSSSFSATTTYNALGSSKSSSSSATTTYNALGSS